MRVPSPRRLICVSVLFSWLLAASASAPTPAAAATTSGFSVRPATFNPADPASRAYFGATVKPGQRFGGAAVVANPGVDPLTLRIYPVDGLTAVTSGAVYAGRGDPPRGAGRWLHTSVSTITLEPRSRRVVAFSARVPGSAWPGDHLGGIAFESADPVRTHGRFSVTEVFRVVIGVEITVPGPARAQLRLLSVALGSLPGSRLGAVMIGLANAGRKLCKPRLTVALRAAGPGRVVSRQLDTILPGDAISYPLAWPDVLAPGRYAITVRAVNCGAAVSLDRTVGAARALAGVSRSRRLQPPRVEARTVTPWWLMVAVAAAGVAAGVAFGVIAPRRRRAQDTVLWVDHAGADAVLPPIRFTDSR